MVIWISDSIAHTCSHLAANPLAHPKFHRNEGGFDPHPNFETIKPLGRTERFYWCSILELVRTHFVACGGEEAPRKNSERRRSRTAQNRKRTRRKTSARTIFCEIVNSFLPPKLNTN